MCPALAIVIVGCAGSGISQKTYDSRIPQVQLGMTKSDFARLFPESRPRGAKAYPNGNVEVIEVLVSYHSFFPTGNPNRDAWTGTESNETWFYFFNGKLVQYGRPNDWPAAPDKIIELRHEY
jgi:hypothetical protein